MSIVTYVTEWMNK